MAEYGFSEKGSMSKSLNERDTMGGNRQGMDHDLTLAICTYNNASMLDMTLKTLAAARRPRRCRVGNRGDRQQLS